MTIRTWIAAKPMPKIDGDRPVGRDVDVGA